MDSSSRAGPRLIVVIDTIEISYYTSRMAMGKRERDRQPAMWVTTTDLPTAATHPFYRRLNQLLREHEFDDFAGAQCASCYAETMGRPGAASETGRIRTSFWILQRRRRWALRRVDARMTNSGCSITVSGAGGTRAPRIPSAMRAAPSPIRRLC